MIPAMRVVQLGKRLHYFMACRTIRENLCRMKHWVRRRWVAGGVWCPVCDAPYPDEA